MGCDRKFRYACHLKEHTDYVHKKIYHHMCDHVGENGETCGKTCETAGDLKQHKKTHNLELQINCSCCIRRFYNQSRLQEHMDFVAGIFNHVCDHIDDNGEKCGFKCEQACQLKVHKNQHIRDAQRDMAPMEDHHVLETPHTVQSWE